MARVVLYLYGQPHFFKGKKVAMEFVENGILDTEGAERDRFVNVWRQLREGRSLCYDDRQAKGESISVGEIVELENMFTEQAKNHVFEHDDIKSGCFYDFVGQYINGDMNPQVRLLCTH